MNTNGVTKKKEGISLAYLVIRVLNDVVEASDLTEEFEGAPIKRTHNRVRLCGAGAGSAGRAGTATTGSTRSTGASTTEKATDNATNSTNRTPNS